MQVCEYLDGMKNIIQKLDSRKTTDCIICTDLGKHCNFVVLVLS